MITPKLNCEVCALPLGICAQADKNNLMCIIYSVVGFKKQSAWWMILSLLNAALKELSVVKSPGSFFIATKYPSRTCNNVLPKECSALMLQDCTARTQCHRATLMQNAAKQTFCIQEKRLAAQNNSMPLVAVTGSPALCFNQKLA